MPRKCILLINQDADTVRICTDLFSTHGFEILVCEGTAEALRMARSEAPAVILTELVARTETEWEIIQVLKGDPEVACIPLIALTAFAQAEDRERAGAADLYVPKPADIREVLADVERLADRATRPVSGSSAVIRASVPGRGGG
jgi:two-component system, cell cycle response regulator DivK